MPGNVQLLRKRKKSRFWWLSLFLSSVYVRVQFKAKHCCHSFSVACDRRPLLIQRQHPPKLLSTLLQPLPIECLHRTTPATPKGRRSEIIAAAHHSSSPKKTLTGSQPSPHTLNRSGRLLNCFISSSVNLWPSIWKFDSILDAVTDFGMTLLPLWRPQRSLTGPC